MRRRRLLLWGAFFLPLLAVAPTLATTAVAAGEHHVRVTQKNFLKIFPNGDNRQVSSYQFVVGPGEAPMGKGSLELQTVDTAGKQQHFEVQQTGTPIADVNEMSYSTYAHQPVVVASINMEVLTDPPGGYTTLVYEPYLNPGAGAVVPGVWQSWDAFHGMWWSTHVIAGVPTRGVPVAWSVIVAANPHAVIIDYGINQGAFNASTTSNVDALSIGTNRGGWTYNFEPTGGGGGEDGGEGGDGNSQGGGDGGGG